MSAPEAHGGDAPPVQPAQGAFRSVSPILRKVELGHLRFLLARKTAVLNQNGLQQLNDIPAGRHGSISSLSRRQSYACADCRFPPHVPSVPNDFLAVNIQCTCVPKDGLHLIVVGTLDYRDAVPADSHSVAAFEAKLFCSPGIPRPTSFQNQV
jgi:hypothetical protein